MSGAKLRLRPWMVLVLVALAGLVYLPTLKHEFVWDDHWMVGDNKDLDAATPFGFFGQSYTHAWASQGMGPHAYYRPLTVASFWLEKTMWGRGPFGFHLSNVVLNAVAGILVALLFMESFGLSWVALLASLVFALHAAQAKRGQILTLDNAWVFWLNSHHGEVAESAVSRGLVSCHLPGQ